MYLDASFHHIGDQYKTDFIESPPRIPILSVLEDSCVLQLSLEGISSIVPAA